MLSEITNYLEISPLLGTAGQPGPAQFDAIHAAGYEVVINLVPAGSPDWLPDEAQRVAALGMAYIHIPVIWAQPTRADLMQFFAALESNRGRKLFVHCVLNMRVSAFVLLYRVLRQGVPLAEAWQPLRRIWEPDDTWRAFIEAQLRAGPPAT
jgi:protein tyrosine phosphatase (PTP) superfamily phosphohydrolase (DUF442 family)